MKKTALSLFLAASVFGLAACNDAEDNVIATSKLGDITQNELYEEMKVSNGKSAFQQIMIGKALESEYSVSDKEVEAEFKANKDELGENFEATLAQYGYTEESFKKAIKLDLLQQKALIEGVEVSEDEIKAQFDVVNKEVKARHILVADEATAKEVLEKLNAGGDFAALAKEYSSDATAESGGDLGWFGTGKMVAEFEEVAFSLEKNKISEPIKTQYGYHILEVLDTRSLDLKYEDEKADIEKQLKLAKADQAALMTKIADMLKDANVKISDKELKTALDDLLASSSSEASTDEKEDSDKSEK